jgi:hypothetical protein
MKEENNENQSQNPIAEKIVLLFCLLTCLGLLLKILFL